MATTKAKLEITFVRDAADGETLSFDIYNNDTTDVVSKSVTFQDEPRRSNNNLEITDSTGIAGEAAAIEFVKYFEIDLNAGKLMSVSRNQNVVTIEMNNLIWDFQNFATTTGATSSITATTGPDLFITNISPQIHPTDPCNYVDLEVTTNVQVDSWGFGTFQNIVATNPFTITIQRQVVSTPNILKLGYDTIENVAEEYYGEPHFYFRKLYEGNIVITVQPNELSGATVTIEPTYGTQLIQRPNILTDLTYSLDNINFDPGNLFSGTQLTGQADGDYTIYVKDQFGCTVSKDYTVSGSGGRDAFFHVSKYNSISFSKDEVWDGAENGVHKNRDNVLSLTDFGKKTLYEERLILRDDDEVTIQFKSNYANHDVEIQNCAGEALSQTPAIVKKSNNTDLFESLDATLTSLGDGRSALFFTSGNVYNEAGGVFGSYELQGNLPDSAIIGVSVEIVGHGVHEIRDIIYSEDLGKKIMVFNYGYNGVDAAVVMKAYYDLLPYEVYEFTVDVSANVYHGNTIEPDLFRVKLQASDGLYGTVNYYSEYIKQYGVSDWNYDKFVSINYWNNNNRDVFYLYGIKHFLRAEVLEVSTIIDDTNEIVKADNTTYVASSTLHEGIKVKFAECTHRMALKLSMALSCENLFINGLGYVKKENISISPIENTNLYEVECELLSNGENFSTVIESETGQSEGYASTITANKLLNVSADELLKT